MDHSKVYESMKQQFPKHLQSVEGQTKNASIMQWYSAASAYFVFFPC